jgi:hypothetical protein
MLRKHTVATLFIANYLIFTPASSVFASQTCSASSAATLTPVVELYTSEGCSSCPPAEKWLGTLKAAHEKGQVVPQAFHVNYWDYIGWKDRFAAPIYTQRQRQISAFSNTDGIYTPQIAKNGRTTRNLAAAVQGGESAGVSIRLEQVAGGGFSARIEPVAGAGAGAGGGAAGQASTAWSAYFTVTEHGHVSKVSSGENKGETLKHDFLVRQFVPLGQYSGAQTLNFSPLPASKDYPRQINLVVHDAKSPRVLQALSVSCNT